MKRIVFFIIVIIFSICMMTGCQKEAPTESSVKEEDPQSESEPAEELSHEERIAREAREIIPTELSFDVSDYPLLDNPPSLEEVLEEDFPAEFVFREEEWTFTEEIEGQKLYTNNKNQHLTLSSDGAYLTSGEADVFERTKADYDSTGKLTYFMSEDCHYFIGLYSGPDASGENEIETTSTHIIIYDNPRYEYSIIGKDELLSTWVTVTEKKDGAEIERRFIYDHTTQSLQECDIWYTKGGIEPYEIKGSYRGDGKLCEVVYIRMDENYVYRYDENFQFIEKDLAVYE